MSHKITISRQAAIYALTAMEYRTKQAKALELHPIMKGSALESQFLAEIEKEEAAANEIRDQIGPQP